MGAWLTPDPIGYRDSSNLYAFAGVDPVNRSDARGGAAYVTYRAFEAPILHDMFPFVGHYFVAFNNDSVEDRDEWSDRVREARRDYADRADAQNVETFSFHPDPRAEHNFLTIFSTGSRIGYDDEIDRTSFKSALRQSRPRFADTRIWRVHVTSEQEMRMYDLAVADRDQIKPRNDVFGWYALFLNDCGGWSQHIVEDGGTSSWPSAAYAYNSGGVGVNGVAAFAFAPELLGATLAAAGYEYALLPAAKHVNRFANGVAKRVATGFSNMRTQLSVLLNAASAGAEHDVKQMLAVP